MSAHPPEEHVASNCLLCPTLPSHHQNVESSRDGDLPTPRVPEPPSSTFSQSPPLRPGGLNMCWGSLNSKLAYSLWLQPVTRVRLGILPEFRTLVILH